MAEAAEVPEGPSGAAFYTAPADLLDGEPGTIIWRQPVDSPKGATSWRILYRSRNLSGEPIAVSGSITIPDNATADSPILSWAHGTTGSADSCAPSKAAGNVIFSVEELVKRGWVGVATDYEGLGTPGLHPYLVGPSEGRGVLDAARVARQLTGAAGKVLIWGHSQGGQAALWAAQIAPKYAPELEVAGTIAVAPASRLTLLSGAAGIKELGGFLVPFFAGMAEAHPDLDLADALTDETLANLGPLEDRCIGDLFAVYAAQKAAAAEPDLARQADWMAAITDNDLGAVRITTPMLVLQGDADTTVPQVMNDGFTSAECAAGGSVDYRVLPGKTHITAFSETTATVMEWFDARVAGAPPTPTCPA